ncbi:hypothetical protein Bca101_057490 [Brassica carinata]
MGRAEATSPVGDDGPGQGHLARGRGLTAPRPPRPSVRTGRAEATSPVGEDGPHRGHFARGQGRAGPRPPRPWARTRHTEATSAVGEDKPHRGHLPVAYHTASLALLDQLAIRPTRHTANSVLLGQF